MLPDDVPDFHVGQLVRFKTPNDKLPYGVTHRGPYPITTVRTDCSNGSKYVVIVEIGPNDQRAIWTDEIEAVVEDPAMICTYKPGDRVRAMSGNAHNMLVRGQIYEVEVTKDGHHFADHKPRIRVVGVPGLHYADRFIVATEPEPTSDYTGNPLYGAF